MVTASETMALQLQSLMLHTIPGVTHVSVYEDTRYSNTVYSIKPLRANNSDLHVLKYLYTTGHCLFMERKQKIALKLLNEFM